MQQTARNPFVHQTLARGKNTGWSYPRFGLRCGKIRVLPLLQLIILFLLLILPLGCSHHMEASPRDIPEPLLLDVPSGQALHLINAQPSTDIVEIGEAGMGRALTGDLQQWTDAAIGTLTQALTKRNIQVREGASKSIQLSVDRAFLRHVAGGWGIACDAYLHVTKGEGYHAAYLGEYVGLSFHRVCDASVNESLKEMLRDEKILQYLGVT